MPTISAPLPQPRPAKLTDTAKVQSTAPANPLATAPDADPACAALTANGQLVFEPAPPIVNGACGAPSPIKVSAIKLADGGSVAISPAATMRCAPAQALADWVRGDVIPAARQHLREPVVELRNAASYDCRGRNRVKGARLSEHGKANALDIGAFKKASGGWVEVGKLGQAKGFFAEVRKKACGRFTTVLGPGSDGYHEEHLHLDLAQRGRNKRALYCR
ncbi:extensin-like domain-containing protein [Agaricicola taiwanensis]|uniref:extensin-like domain-containing protein n=1 Tax=Agaricicola taiwanensis TaxID=591372 RepID=UPI00166E4272|nr:extensin family protein [Agaricicola taiwanensis]